MVSVLKIERIGNPRQGWRPAWVDHIVALAPHGLRKERISGHVDYTEANSVGSRGVYCYYFLEPGHLYHVSAPVSWCHVDQYFCVINERCEIERLTIEEVVNCLRRKC